MDKIILDLLKENGRVIIPDFGAFIVKQKSPFTVIFNEFLQYNDGALIGAVSTKENIERDDAATKTREFIKEIQDKLSKGEEVTLLGIGVLTKSSTGKISIKEVGASAEGSAEAPKKPDPAKTVTQKKEESKTVEFDLDEKKKPSESEPPKKEAEKPAAKKVLPGGMPESKIKKELPNTAPKKVVPSTATKKEMPKPAPKKEIPRPTPIKREEPVRSAETPPINEYYSEEGGKNKWNIVLWIVVILVVNGAIIGFFFFSDEIKSFFGKKPDVFETQLPETTPIEEEIPAIIDTLTEEPVAEPVIESTPEEVEEQQAPQEMFAGTKYYVVAGVFNVEANADNLVADLRKQGYNSEKFAKIGNMHAVCYDVFPTKREADRLMLKIQRDVNSGVWIKIID